MHSKIFQIAKEPVNKGCYLQEDTLTQGDGSFYDYCTEIDDEERKKEIANLVKFILPKGMFELTSEDTIRYIGGMEQWKEKYVANIHKKAEALTVENMLVWGSIYYLKQKSHRKPTGHGLSFLSRWGWLPGFCGTILCFYGIYLLH